MEKIYHRVSTQRQSYAQQKECVERYLKSVGKNYEDYEVTEEKISGCKDFADRELNNLINSCEAGDVIYVSELSRLGRDMTNLFVLVDMATKRGIKIIQCKDGMSLEKDSIAGKTLLFALSIAAELEAEQKRQRIEMGHAAKKKEIAETGGFTNRRGEYCDGDYAAQYGKRSGGSFERSCEIARAKRAENMRKKAQENPNNVAFADYVALYEERNGYITPQTDITQLTNELNRMKLTTATGLPFDNQRTRSMLNKIRKIYVA